eukprot:jgi/Tetstr1/463432/TSEL_000736.t1
MNAVLLRAAGVSRAANKLGGRQPLAPVFRHHRRRAIGLVPPLSALKPPSQAPDSHMPPFIGNELPEADPASKSVEVVFHLPEEERPGRRHKLVGSCPELGEWDLGNGLDLEAEGANEWSATVVVPCGSTCEFKAVLVDEDTAAEEWEAGSVRKFTVPDGPSSLGLRCEWNRPEEYTLSYLPGDPGAPQPRASKRPSLPAASMERLCRQYADDLAQLLAQHEAELAQAEAQLQQQESVVAGLRAQAAEVRALAAEVDAAMRTHTSLEALLDLVATAFPATPPSVPQTVKATAEVAPANVLEAQRWIAAWRATQEVPANVLEAQRWIATWRATQEVPANVLEAQRWIAAWRAGQDESLNVEEAQRWIGAWRATQEVPANVKEAQRWIAAWRATQEVPANVLEAQRWIAAWRANQEVPANVLEAQRWIAAWRAGQDEPLNVEEAQRWIGAWRATQEVPANVKEAQRWIAAWRATQEVPSNVLEAQRWIAAWRANQEVPANVLEAQRWIAAWRAGQDEPLNVKEAQRWIAAWRANQKEPTNVLEAQRWIAAWRATQEVPANVLEAQRWIAAWRAGQEESSNVEEAQRWIAAWRVGQEEPANVLEAQRWIAAWRASQEEPANVREAQRWIATWRATQEVPANVLEAQRWIAAWRATQDVPTNVLEAQRWIAAWRANQEVPENVLEAQRWIAAWRTSQADGDVGDAPSHQHITLPPTTDPETVLALVRVIASASKRAIAERGAFCLALSGGPLENAAVMLASASAPPADAARWHVCWAAEANVPASDADSRFGAARAAFLGTATVLQGSQVHPAPVRATAAQCAADYSAVLAALPAEVLPRQPSSGLPVFDLIMVGRRAALEGRPPPDDTGAWVAPHPTGHNAVALTQAAVDAAVMVCSHTSSSSM